MLSEVWKFACSQVETMAAITPQIAKLVKLTLLLVFFLNFFLLTFMICRL